MNAIKIIIESNMPFHHLHISLTSIEKATVGKIKKYIYADITNKMDD